MRSLVPIFSAAFLGIAALSTSAEERQKKLLVDFEDFGTWRLTKNSGIKPGYWWPDSVCLSGSDVARYRDDLVGELKFAFAEQGPFLAEFTRAKTSMVAGFLDGVEFDASANDLPVALKFELLDATNRSFATFPVKLSGREWRHYRLALNKDTVANFDKIKFPARLRRISLEAATPCEGRVLLDDILITGTFAKKDQLSIQPVFEKISNAPGEEITLRYRLRNALPGPMKGSLRVELRDFGGKQLLARDVPFDIPAIGSQVLEIPAGKFSIGAYEVMVRALSGELETNFQDHFNVVKMNDGQPNQMPMWFGICDQTTWQADLENRRHSQWMNALGVDINRMGLFPDRFEPVEGQINEDGWRRMIQYQADAGVDVMVLYSVTPPWTHTQYKWRAAPDLWPQFEGHAQRLGAFLKRFPSVTALEMWNEPDLDFFDGNLDEYVVMFEHFHKGFKKSHPDLPLTSGGVTIQHPKEKPGFSRGMYEQTSNLFDIAAYHAHGPLPNTVQHEGTVERWLKELGIDKPIYNTETGERSLYTPEGRRQQAITLVKKVVYSKSRPNFQAYFWFTLQDYWDMDEEADDSFGLVTSDNRPKASFAAYNNLIAQLANAAPVESDLPEGDLSLYAFKKDDGRFVYAGWPNAAKSSGILWIETQEDIAVTDMFGAQRNYTPVAGVLPVPFGDLPLYITGGQIRAAASERAFLDVPSQVRYSTEASMPVPVRFRNPGGEPIQGSLVLRSPEGVELSREKFTAAANQEITWSPVVEAANRVLQVELWLGEKEAPAFSFPVKFIQMYVIERDEMQKAQVIALDRPEQVVEMAFDPSTPAWKGPADLSAKIRVVHDEEGLRIHAEVTDDKPGQLNPKDQMWRGDDIQLAFAGPDTSNFAIVDIGQSAEGPAVWCSQNPDTAHLGQWDAPITVSRQGSVTTYEVCLTFEQLGITPAQVAAKNLRLTFLVNEDDGKGRVRWIEWTPGIARERSLEPLGYGTLK